MSLKIYNTLTQKKETFAPVRPGKVGIYLCGPTVYKPSHIGHAVGPIIFDTVKRYLSFKGFEVNWVVNITDVEDKLIAEAQGQNCSVFALAERITASYLEALAKLGIRGIDYMPKASEHMDEMVNMCKRLIAKDAAYVSNGDVYFDITADDDYGKLSHRNPDDQQAGRRELEGEEKRHPADFALWKASKESDPDEVRFDSPWGKGRPGWHIECSAMAAKYLGQTFDIHGGGMDLIFPHHENEIAQSETCFGAPFARCWMHNGLTRFNTKKISKSDADMQKMMAELTLDNLLNKYSPELLRFFVLSTHYRRPIEFSDAEMTARKKGIDTFYRLFERIQRGTGTDPYAFGKNLDRYHEEHENDFGQHFILTCFEDQVRFLEAMDDDFNTAGAIGVLFEMAGAINRFLDEEKLETSDSAELKDLACCAVGTLRKLACLLGLFEHPPTKSGADNRIVEDLMTVLIDVRSEARKSKQYQLGDLIRDRLSELGITLEDRPDGTGWRQD